MTAFERLNDRVKQLQDFEKRLKSIISEHGSSGKSDLRLFVVDSLLRKLLALYDMKQVVEGDLVRNFGSQNLNQRLDSDAPNAARQTRVPPLPE